MNGENKMIIIFLFQIIFRSTWYFNVTLLSVSVTQPPQPVA